MNSSEVHHNLFRLRALVILSGILLMLGGMVMVFMDLKSDGAISIKTPVFSGSINATYIGLLVIFMGVALEAIAILRTYRHKDDLQITRVSETPHQRSQKGKKALLADSDVSTEEIRALFKERFGVEAPDSLRLDDVEIRRTMQHLLTDPAALELKVAGNLALHRETFKFKSESSGARLASRQ